MQLGVVLNKDRQHLSVLLDNIPETTTRGECSHCPQKYLLQIKVVGGIFFFSMAFCLQEISYLQPHFNYLFKVWS